MRAFSAFVLGGVTLSILLCASNAQTAPDLRPALDAVTYRDCGHGGSIALEVRFEPDGHASAAKVVGGAVDAVTSTCVARRFASARSSPFTGDAVTIRWSIALDPIPVAPDDAANAPLRPARKDQIGAPLGWHWEEHPHWGIAGTGFGLLGGGALLLLLQFSIIHSGGGGDSLMLVGSAGMCLAGLYAIPIGLATTKRKLVKDGAHAIVVPLIDRDAKGIALLARF